MWKRVAQAAGLLTRSALIGSGQNPGRPLPGSGQNQGRPLTGSGQKSRSGIDRIMMTSASGLTRSKTDRGSYWVGFSDWVKLTSA